MTGYIRDPAEIYRQSFATIRAEADLSALPADLGDVAVRMIHACGMTDIVSELRWSPDFAARARRALAAGAKVVTDSRMVADGIIDGKLRSSGRIVCVLDTPELAHRAAVSDTTRTATAISLARSALDGAIAVIGNAPTALFRLLELIDEGAARPAAVVALPVGFVGAAESKAELAANPRGMPFLTLLGRRGGSAMAAAAVNALAAGEARS
jgi:precorrin-8X/cobalt-precorrin-8 methylmutase